MKIEEQTGSRSAAESENHREPWKPYSVREEIALLALFLAEQDTDGTKGETFNVLKWNQDNELGGFETWGWGPDVEAARAAGTL